MKERIGVIWISGQWRSTIVERLNEVQRKYSGVERPDIDVYVTPYEVISLVKAEASNLRGKSFDKIIFENNSSRALDDETLDIIFELKRKLGKDNFITLKGGR